MHTARLTVAIAAGSGAANLAATAKASAPPGASTEYSRLAHTRPARLPAQGTS